MSKIKQTKFNISGIHCRSCKTLIETEVKALPGVESIEVDYQRGEAEISYDREKLGFDKIKNIIEKVGYQVSDSFSSTTNPKTDEAGGGTSGFVKGLIIPIAIAVFIFGYFLLQRLGGFEVLSRLNESNLSYGLIFLIGFLVSFHCIGMCGGLVVTYSVGVAAKNQGGKSNISWSHIQYNAGRLISYTTIGGILGGVGSFFGVNPVFTGALMLFAGIFMLLMGLSLLTEFKWLQKFNFKTPDFIARFLYGQKHNQKSRGPFVIGLLNGFMPCGPLQAMQLYALGTGSVWLGATSMAFYALGTIPLMFGFGAFISFLSKSYIKKIMKFSGAIVIVLALVMVNRGLTNFGWGIYFGPVNNAPLANTNNNVNPTGENYQIAQMELNYNGYSPSTLRVKAGIPVRWVINVKQMSGCTNEIIMPTYSIKKKLQYGENIIEFTPKQKGEVKFSCWMRMVWGKFIVE